MPGVLLPASLRGRAEPCPHTDADVAKHLPRLTAKAEPKDSSRASSSS